MGLFKSSQPHEIFSIELSDSEWRQRLSPAEFAVLREAATEPPGSSPLGDEKRSGSFVCAGCAQALFSSDTKYESGSGWPSFFAPVDGAVGTKTDHKLLSSRTEVHCSRCGGHLGHVFEDGPAPTGQRFCMNGTALKFAPADDL